MTVAYIYWTKNNIYFNQNKPKIVQTSLKWLFWISINLQFLCCYCLCVFNKIHSAEASLPEPLLNDVSVGYQAAQVRRCLCGSRMTVCLSWKLTKSGHFSVMNPVQPNCKEMMSTNALVTLFLLFTYFSVLVSDVPELKKT